MDRSQQIDLRIALDFAWKMRLRQSAEADRKWVEAGQKSAEAGQMWSSANQQWIEAIQTFCGNITMEWIYRPKKSDCACLLETGELFEP